MDDDRNPQQTKEVLSRALELARSGRYCTIVEIRNALRDENLDDTLIRGRDVVSLRVALSSTVWIIPERD